MRVENGEGTMKNWEDPFGEGQGKQAERYLDRGSHCGVSGKSGTRIPQDDPSLDSKQ